MPYTPQTWVDGPAGLTPVSAARLAYMEAGIVAAGSGGGGGSSLTPTAVKTTSYTAAASDFVPVDTTSGNVAITFPTAPADKTQIAVKHVVRGGTNLVTFVLGGSDVFNVAGGVTSGTLLTLLNQAGIYQYKASGAIWYAIASDISLSQLDLRFAPTNTRAVVTSEALAAGDFINLWNSSGIKARRADGSTSGKRAHGFVLASATSGGTATVYTAGINTAVSGATPGSDAFLSDSTPGGYVSTAPTGSGKTVQYLGPILSATEIAYEPTIPVVLA